MSYQQCTRFRTKSRLWSRLYRKPIKQSRSGKRRYQLRFFHVRWKQLGELRSSRFWTRRWRSPTYFVVAADAVEVHDLYLKARLSDLVDGNVEHERFFELRVQSSLQHGRLLLLDSTSVLYQPHFHVRIYAVSQSIIDFPCLPFFFLLPLRFFFSCFSFPSVLLIGYRVFISLPHHNMSVSWILNRPTSICFASLISFLFKSFQVFCSLCARLNWQLSSAKHEPYPIVFESRERQKHILVSQRRRRLWFILLKVWRCTIGIRHTHIHVIVNLRVSSASYSSFRRLKVMQ